MAGSLTVDDRPLTDLLADVQAQEAELRRVCAQFGRNDPGVYSFSVEDALTDFKAARRAYDLAVPADDLPF